jgi:4-amino-4-deoxy-L-arabinose transferase-like glycosyltransferase
MPSIFISKKFPSYALICAVFALSACFLFLNLGRYALWDDESVSALVALGVQRTGDTSVILDHNIIAYRSGLLVRDGKDRSTPPLSTYLTAAAFSAFGVSAFSARLPSACFGLATVGLLLWYCRNCSLRTQIIFSLGILGNVSLFLFCRQARYYAAGLFFSTVIVCIYSRWKGSWQGALVMATLGVFLFATNYLAYAALSLCLVVDWFIWKRSEIFWNAKNLLALVLPQMMAIPLIASIWNPFGTGFGEYVAQNSIWDRFVLFFWNLRDLNGAEFLVGPLVLAGCFLAWKNRDEVLTRMLVALVCYVGFVSLVSPQTLSNTSVADVRYLVPVIPLGIAICTIVIVKLTGGYRLLGIALALLAFQTNVINGGPFLYSGARSTMAEFSREISSPLEEPYTIVSGWIQKNVQPSESVAVFPDYMVYPLMFRVAHPVYAWQLKMGKKSRFGDVEDIHFEGRYPPDFFVLFGPVVADFLQASKHWESKGWRYEHIATLNTFWKDLYRPELFWRTFRPINQFDPNLEAIQVFRRKQNDSN